MSRKRSFLYFAIASIMIVMLAGCGDDNGLTSSGISGTPIQAVIDSDQTLTIGSSPYLVSQDVEVLESATLTIDPGVEILFNGFYSFEVHGTMIARGDSSNIIHFSTAKSPKGKGDWRGILLDHSDASVMEYVQVSYAAKYNIIQDTTSADTILHRGAITVLECSPTITRCILDNAGYDGIHIVGNSSPSITYNTIVKNAFNGIRIEPNLANEYGDPLIASNIIVENDDSGIRAPDRFARPIIRYNNIWNNASLDYLPLSLSQLAQTDVHLNPFFIDIEAGNYHLHPCSGAIDKGDPSDASDPDGDGTIPDVGAFPHFQALNELSHTLRDSRLHLVSDYEYYLVVCDVLVEEGTTLEIDPGVEIRFTDRYDFVIRGTIQANGTSDAPIVFTSGEEEPARADWKNLLLDGAGDDSYLDYVILEYGSVDNISNPLYRGALSIKGCSPRINSLTIRQAYDTGLLCYDGASPTITDLTIDGAGLMGISCELNSNPVITRTMISDISGYGIMFSGNCNAVMNNLLINDISVSGIVIENLSNPVITNATIHAPSSHAVRLNNSCNPIISNSIFVDYGNLGLESLVSSRPVVQYCDFFTDSPTAILYRDGWDTEPDPARWIDVLETDPLFVDVAGGDFRLQADSPCVDAGDPDPAFNDSDGSQNDMGAFGGPLAW